VALKIGIGRVLILKTLGYNPDEEMKYPSQIINLLAGVETLITTTLLTKPYNVEVFDSIGNIIESTIGIRVSWNGATWDLYIYSTDAINNAELYILY
jgi:hypothetical protein